MQNRDLCYTTGRMANTMSRAPRRPYVKSDESPWQKARSVNTTGQEKPLLVQQLPHKELQARVKALIAQGVGDGSIAVRLNREGVECSRADVYYIRTGRQAPDGQGGFEELTVVKPNT